MPVFTLSAPRQAQLKLIGWRTAIHEIRAPLPTITVRAFIRRRIAMPADEFCCVVKAPHGLSVTLSLHATDLPR